MANDRQRAWIEHDDEDVPAPVDEQHATTSAPRGTTTVVERELAVRLNRRGERGTTAMGITWL